MNAARPLLALIATIAGCGGLVMCSSFGEDAPPAGTEAGVDAPADQALPDVSTPDGSSEVDASAGCRLRPWLTPAAITVAPQFGEIRSARLGSDGLVYVSGDKSPNDGIFTGVLTGASLALSVPDRLTALESAEDDTHPAPASDALSVFFESKRMVDGGGPATFFNVFRSKRPSHTETFQVSGLTVIAADEVNIDVRQPYVAGPLLYYTVAGGGNDRLRTTELANLTGTTPTLSSKAVMGLDDSTDRNYPVVTPDNLELFFASSGGTGMVRIYRAKRTSIGDPFELPRLEPLGVAGIDVYPTWISPDGCEMFFIENGPTRKLFRVKR